MAIIQPSRKFEGSNLEKSTDDKYILPSVRVIDFKDKYAADGVHLFFLPAYKQDSSGDGVWFNQINIRQQFGDGFKKKYYVKNKESDPATYFEKSFKALYPDESKPKDKPGTKYKTYPNFGYISRRVLFNVALYDKLTKGAPVEESLFVLDLPAVMGADILQKWMNTKRPNGELNPIVNDPTAAIVTHVKLDVESTPPWSISPDATEKYEIPSMYADSDTLYNLDEIFIEKSSDQIIDELRAMYPTDIFEACMAGYRGYTSAAKKTQQVVRISETKTAEPEDEIPMEHAEEPVKASDPLPRNPIKTAPVISGVSSNDGPKKLPNPGNPHKLDKEGLSKLLKKSS